MAITPSRGRKPGKFGRRFRSKLRPRLGVIETPSGDGMTTKRPLVTNVTEDGSKAIWQAAGSIGLNERRRGDPWQVTGQLSHNR
jgi:hypothetical protein